MGKDLNPSIILLKIDNNISKLHASRRVFEILKTNNIDTAVIHHFQTSVSDSNELALAIGTCVGPLMTDGLGDGLLIEQVGKLQSFALDYVRKTSFALLQGCRMRSTKTEFVSCPSCGRTLFDLQTITGRRLLGKMLKKKLQLKNLLILLRSTACGKKKI